MPTISTRIDVKTSPAKWTSRPQRLWSCHRVVVTKESMRQAHELLHIIPCPPLLHPPCQHDDGRDHGQPRRRRRRGCCHGRGRGRRHRGCGHVSRCRASFRAHAHARYDVRGRGRCHDRSCRSRSASGCLAAPYSRSSGHPPRWAHPIGPGPLPSSSCWSFSQCRGRDHRHRRHASERGQCQERQTRP